ncbi:hypothetical protein FAGAP_5091 [Fusarium agapanthi]|uniref:Protein kinase domain-containing protein n=1 Tax=Fusarium agapanthi TaxID=1803897 RepID=A0A9P5BC70_9HYPO|nr:hypothetical protein FAGAP_5091 [Fusarium agapanthi]
MASNDEDCSFSLKQPEEPAVRLEEGFNKAFRQSKRKIKIDILATYPSTESHMMRVRFKNSTGGTQVGVLKLYDRRYAGRIRQVNDQATAPLLAADTAYLRFVRQGKMGPFSSAVEHIYKTAPVTPRASHSLHNQSYGGVEADRVARFEAATCSNPFKAKRYRASSHMCEFHMLPYDEQWDEFLCVHGLILEHIAGPRLEDWPTPNTAAGTLKAVAQLAVLAMDEMNKLGVLLEKNSNNVIVEGGYDMSADSPEPLIVDFAEAVFKKDLVKIKIKQLDTSKLLATEELHHRMDIAY